MHWRSCQYLGNLNCAGHVQNRFTCRRRSALSWKGWTAYRLRYLEIPWICLEFSTKKKEKNLLPRVGIDPTFPVPQTGVLPLNYRGLTKFSSCLGATIMVCRRRRNFVIFICSWAFLLRYFCFFAKPSPCQSIRTCKQFDSFQIDPYDMLSVLFRV